MLDFMHLLELDVAETPELNQGYPLTFGLIVYT